MKETRFIEQNRNKWEELEKQLNQDKKDPDKLSDLFVQVADDLSYARTYYKNRVVRVYLNHLTQKVFGSLYKNTLNQKKRFNYFWRQDLPEILFLSRKELRLSLIIFLLSMTLGIVSSIYDPNFCASILGESYVSMTKENIKSGDPMAVYKDANGVNMFLGITINNLFVAYRTFIFGLLASIGTIGIMIYNGVMVGVFQYFFIEQGLFRESALTIWMHGMLEISAIIIAGGAGLVLGKGIVLPGTFNRMQALRISARSAIKIMIGITPIFILAGLIESFITRLTELNDVIRFIIILSEFILIIAYFFWLPRKLGKKGIPFRLNDNKIPVVKPFDFSIYTIKNAGVLFGEAFTIFNILIRKLIYPIIAIAICLAIVQLNFIQPEDEQINGIIGNLPLSGLHAYPTIYIYYTLTISILAAAFGFYWRRNKQLNLIEINLNLKNTFKRFLITFLIIASFFILLIPDYTGTVFLFCLLPILLFILSLLQISPLSLGEVFKNLRKLIITGLLNLYGFYFAMIFIGYLWILLVNRLGALLNAQMLEWFFEGNNSNYIWFKEFLSLFQNAAGILFFIPILLIGTSIHYFSVKEIIEANGLKSKLRSIHLNAAE
jgi:uncharacterized membrane protein SpoIIM required for sporulation